MSPNAAGPRATPISTVPTCAPRWRGPAIPPPPGPPRKARLAATATQPLLMAYAEPEGPAPDPDLLRGAYGLIAVARPDDLRRAALEQAARAAGAAVCAFLPLPLAEADIAAARRADGYVMLQAAPGVTGPRPSLDPANGERLALSARAGRLGAAGAGLRRLQRRAGPRGCRLGRRRGGGGQRGVARGAGGDGGAQDAAGGFAEGARWLICFWGWTSARRRSRAGCSTREGGLVAHASRPYPTARPAPGLVEQDPRDWVAGVEAVIDALTEDGRAERVAAMGMCGQVNTDAFVDAQGRPLAPAIAWADNRAAADAAALDADVSMQDRLDWWGAPLPVGASHVLARMAWMARERPEVYAATAQVLAPKDFCLRALAGATVSDAMSNFFVVGLDSPMSSR